jgi:hypothetical protein
MPAGEVAVVAKEPKLFAREALSLQPEVETSSGKVQLLEVLPAATVHVVDGQELRNRLAAAGALVPVRLQHLDAEGVVALLRAL